MSHERSSPASQAEGACLPVLARVVLVWLGFVLWMVATRALRDLVPASLPFDLSRSIVAVAAGAVGLAVIAAVCRLEGRTLQSLGLGSLRVRGARALLVGAGLATALAAVGLAVASATGSIRLADSAPTPSLVGWFALQLGLVFCLEALPEELAFRGYFFVTLEERWRQWWAVLGQAVLFTSMALAGRAVSDALGMGAPWSVGLERLIGLLGFGLTVGLVRLWIGSVWATIGFHLAFQTIAQLAGLDRLPLVVVPAGPDRETVYHLLWLFVVVGGGLVALGALARRRARR